MAIGFGQSGHSNSDLILWGGLASRRLMAIAITFNWISKSQNQSLCESANSADLSPLWGIRFSTASNNLEWHRRGNTPGIWNLGDIPLGLHQLIVAQDGVNPPLAWLDGNAASPQIVSAAPTSVVNATAPILMGNSHDRSLCFQGELSEIAIWNTSSFSLSDLISSEIATSITNGFSPLIWLQNLRFYSPLYSIALDSKSTPVSGRDGTLNKEHPLTFYPAFVRAASPPGEAITRGAIAAILDPVQVSVTAATEAVGAIAAILEPVQVSATATAINPDGSLPSPIALPGNFLRCPAGYIAPEMGIFIPESALRGINSGNAADYRKLFRALIERMYRCYLDLPNSERPVAIGFSELGFQFLGQDILRRTYQARFHLDISNQDLVPEN